MVHIRYRDLRPEDIAAQHGEELLRKLLRELLLRSDGDVEQALEALERIGERYGLFGEGKTIDDFRRGLKRDRIIHDSPRGSKLSPKGERQLRHMALEQLFRDLRDGDEGQHRTPRVGSGGERSSETRPWQFGDELTDIDFTGSYRKAFQRGLDARLREDDLEVYERERHVGCATALLLDVSHSMILYGEDRITPAKRVALALSELITTRYPRDALHLILFGDEAWEISIKELTYAGVGPFHTNTHGALALARRILMRRKHANKRIIMITDGKPSAISEPGGEIYINSFGLDPYVVNKTLNEAIECKRHQIPITTFMIARDAWLVDFVDRLTALNGGQACYAGLDDLGRAVLSDFVQRRR